MSGWYNHLYLQGEDEVKRAALAILYSLLLLGLWVIANRYWLSTCDCGDICDQSYRCQLKECHP